MKIKPTSALVKTRSHRRYRNIINPKGFIYMPSSWLGAKVKVVPRDLYVKMVKRIKKLDGILRRIKKEAKKWE